MTDLLVLPQEDAAAREAWLRERLKSVGASDAAAVAGVSPWRTPIDVWLEKTEQIPLSADEDSGPTYWGRRLEALILDEYRIRTGHAIGHQGRVVRHRDFPWMTATVDAIAIPPNGGPRPVEAKSTRWAKEWGDPDSDEIPLPYVFQTQHQLAVTGYSVADVAVLIGGSDFRLYRVERDEQVIEKLIEVEREFWQAVEERRPPPVRTSADAAKLFPRHAPGKMQECDDKHYELWRELGEARSAKKKIVEVEDFLKAQLQEYMGEAEMLTLQGDVLATWRRTAPVRRVDTKKLAKEQPTIYAAYLKPSEGERRFLYKDED